MRDKSTIAKFKIPCDQEEEFKTAFLATNGIDNNKSLLILSAPSNIHNEVEITIKTAKSQYLYWLGRYHEQEINKTKNSPV